MDKALLNRFTRVEMDLLTEEEEYGLLTYMFPHVDSKLLESVAKIVSQTRIESSNETGKISSGISTRASVEMAGLLFDGFGLEEAAEVLVFPEYSNDGGMESERTFVKQIVQKYIDDGSSDELFNESTIDEGSGA